VSKLIENEQFSGRLRLALKGVGVRPSATALAKEFNLRDWGESVTVNTAPNWLLGKSIPKQFQMGNTMPFTQGGDAGQLRGE
jgi:hypothetical protein